MNAIKAERRFPSWLEPQPRSLLARYVEAIRTAEPDEPPEDSRNLARMVIGAAFDEAWKAKPNQDIFDVGAIVAERLGSDLTADRICFLAVADMQAALRLADPFMLEARKVALAHLAQVLRSVDLSTH